MSTFHLKVNGRSHTVDVDPTTPLLYVLRNDLGLQGPKFGCGLGQCGACKVIISGTAVPSVSFPCRRSGARSPHSRGLPPTAGCTRCSRRGSTSRFRSAGSVRTGRSDGEGDARQVFSRLAQKVMLGHGYQS